MPGAPKPIAIVQGASSAAIQRLLREFAVGISARVVGLVERDDDNACGSARLVSLADGSVYSLFQDLGAGSQSCGLDSEGVVLAGEVVTRDIAQGCDLVVLSKFGKLEAENRAGLMTAFIAAIEAGVPVLTAVSPKQMAAWDAFAAPFYSILPAEAEALATWWSAIKIAKTQSLYFV